MSANIGIYIILGSDLKYIISSKKKIILLVKFCISLFIRAYIYIFFFKFFIYPFILSKIIPLDLDPDPNPNSEFGSGSTDQNESGSNRIRLRIHIPGKIAENSGLYNKISCDNRSVYRNVEKFYSIECMSEGKNGHFPTVKCCVACVGTHFDSFENTYRACVWKTQFKTYYRINHNLLLACSRTNLMFSATLQSSGMPTYTIKFTASLISRCRLVLARSL